MQVFKFSESEVLDIVNECFYISEHFLITSHNIKWYSKEKPANSSFTIRWLKDKKHYLERKFLNIFSEDILLPPEANKAGFCIYSYSNSKIEKPIVRIKISFKMDNGKIFGSFTFVKEEDDLFWTEAFWVCADTQRDPEQQRISWLLDAAQTDSVKKFILNKVLPLSLV